MVEGFREEEVFLYPYLAGRVSLGVPLRCFVRSWVYETNPISHLSVSLPGDPGLGLKMGGSSVSGWQEDRISTFPNHPASGAHKQS